MGFSPTPVWFITGASSGFGGGIALEALDRGHRVIASARNAAKLADLKSAGAEVISLDVTGDLSEIKKIVEEWVEKYGRIDYLVNAAGFIMAGAIEETNPAETHAQFATNVYGTLNVTRAVLPHMRARHFGVIVNFGSLGSWRGGPGYGLYAATKWAVSGITESLAPEVAQFGISACCVEPGYFRSSFLNPGVKNESETTIKEYRDTRVGQTMKELEQADGKQLGDVEKGVKVIVDVLTKSGVAEGREIPVRLVLGSDCVAVVREKCQSTLQLMDEWEEISVSTDYPKGQ